MMEKPAKGNIGMFFAWMLAAVLAVAFIGALLNSHGTTGGSPSEPKAPQEIVHNDPDGTVIQVWGWLRQNANDPGSVDYVWWGKVVHLDNGNFAVRVKYRAKNGFGALMLYDEVFGLDSNGHVLSHISTDVLSSP